MKASFHCVVTTINAPGASMKALNQAVADSAGVLLVVGDKRGPVALPLAGARLIPLVEQLDLPWRLARLLPTGHYSRKNLGYLIAMQEAAEAIFETDDDNAPAAGWRPRRLQVDAVTVSAPPWFNVYSMFSNEMLWPRGFPLGLLRANSPAGASAATAESFEAPIQQGLVDDSPDVDAIWRLVWDRPVRFQTRESVRLAPGTWCPFNSQWTWWWPAAYPFLYLPSFCSFRMTDIWRSFVAQKCLWQLGAGVVFHSPDAVQERNPHNLLRDFEDEIPGYLQNERICAMLDGLQLTPGPQNAGANLKTCYEALVSSGFLPAEELTLVEAWIEGVEKTKAAN